MSKPTAAEFTGWRAYIWPVHNYELPKLLPMLLILFLLTVNYNIVRVLKDTLVVATKSSIGAEVIPYIKVWMMFPGSVFLTYVFTRLSNRLKRETVFYLMMGIFIGYYALFVFILYPNKDWIHPHGFADAISAISPRGVQGFISMIRNWSFTTFYVMSELWGNIVLFLLFWAFANEVTKLGEAKRFYAILGVATNLSGIFAGAIGIRVGQLGYLDFLPYGTTAWDQQIFIMVLIVMACGLSSVFLYWWLHRKVLDKEEVDEEESKQDDVRGKLSMMDNFTYLFKSRYLIGIAVITVAYNIIINFVEVMWKSQVKELYPDPADYNVYMNQVLMIIGVIATLASSFLTGNIIRVFGWTRAAMIAPIVMTVTSVAFVGSFLFKEQLTLYSALLFGLSPVAIVAHLGTLQNCLSRGAKYTVYDATKEMAFIPLSRESKLKGKAAIDGVCSRLGKSGASFTYQILLYCTSTLPACVPYVAFILGLILMVWMGAVRFLGREFHHLATGERKPVRAAPVGEPVPQMQ